MKDFNKISKNAENINDLSQEIVYHIDDLKRDLIGFMVNRDYDAIYDYLDSMMKSIESIKDSGIKIGWLSDDVKTAILGVKDDNN